MVLITLTHLDMLDTTLSTSLGFLYKPPRNNPGEAPSRVLPGEDTEVTRQSVGDPAGECGSSAHILDCATCLGYTAS